MSDKVHGTINKWAYQNCVTKLKKANERIVEFDDIKKAHLEYVENLKSAHAELLKQAKELREGIAEVIRNSHDILAKKSCSRVLAEFDKYLKEQK